MSEIDGYCNQSAGVAMIAAAFAMMLLIGLLGLPVFDVFIGTFFTGGLLLLVGSLQLRSYYREEY